MEVMISVNPPYADMIMSGYKPFEFRKSVLKGMDEGYPLEDITAYIYETKNKGGSGTVIGEVTVSGAYTVNYERQSKEQCSHSTELVQERADMIKSLYLYWCKLKGIKPNMNEGWFKSKRFSDYEKEIGFGTERMNFNYALVLDAPKRYDTALPLSFFVGSSGNDLKWPPQNMCHVKQRV